MAVRDNVFRGPQSVAQYFDPESNPPLPLVEIPDRLNPFRKDGVRIYAKMLTCLPAQNVKSLPGSALHMLRMEPRAQSRKIAEASSGSTILSLGIIARVLWGNENIEAHVTNKKSMESLNLLRFFGIRPCLFAGLAQQEPTDPTGIMARLRRRTKECDDMVYLGQYDNDDNWKAHAAWTGPQILRQLPETNVFCTTVGTGGCITGTGVYLKAQKPSIRVLGVFNVAGDPTPGPRYYDGFQSSSFPWQETIDSRVEVSSASAYRMSMRLSREGIICGPSSGEALQGLLQYLTDLKRSGKLGDLVDQETNEISCVFTCSDLPYQYLSTYFEKLGTDEFPTIENEVTKHDLRWILDSDKALELLNATPDHELDKACIVESSLLSLSSSEDSLENPVGQHIRRGPTPSTLVIDLRSRNDFDTQHIPRSLSVPLPGLYPGLAGGDLFGDAEAVHMIWTAMQKWLLGTELSQSLFDAIRDQRPVLVLCYDGFTSQLGCSAIRKMGLEAFTVRGGFQALWLQTRKEEKV
ncbi:cysteine synthase [Pyrenochaeta sp. MPI-SDFR-AT-0127]|nr:cysteine synthase [Pyrenochaeta sp. MPI-SDFR-AT-0127]